MERTPCGPSFLGAIRSHERGGVFWSPTPCPEHTTSSVGTGRPGARQRAAGGGGGRAGAQLGSSVVPPLQPFFFPGPPFRELWTLGFICPPAFSLRLSCVLVDFCYLTIHLLNILLLLPYFKSVITSLIFFFKSASSGFKKSLFNILEPSFLPFPGYLCLQ